MVSLDIFEGLRQELILGSFDTLVETDFPFRGELQALGD